MTENIANAVGATPVAFSFPTPGVFQLRLLRIDLRPERRVSTFDVLFFGATNVTLKNDGPLEESKVMEVQKDGPHDIRFRLANGLIAIKYEYSSLRCY